jgi:hypothetical protein
VLHVGELLVHFLKACEPLVGLFALQSFQFLLGLSGLIIHSCLLGHGGRLLILGFRYLVR